MPNIIDLKTDDFEDVVLKSSKPFLVDFWAAWCNPCRAVAPVVEQIAEELSETLAVGKLNIDDEPAIAQRYRVMSIPTLLLFKNGEASVVSIGAAPKEELLKRIEPCL